MADAFYDSFLTSRNLSNIRFVTEHTRVILLNDTYPAVTGLATHDRLIDVEPYEVVGTGYTSSKIVSIANNYGVYKEGAFDGAAISDLASAVLLAQEAKWTGADFFARYAALYCEASFSQFKLIALLDLGSNVHAQGDFILPLRSDGNILEANTEYSMFYAGELAQSMRYGVTVSELNGGSLQMLSSAYTFDSAHTATETNPHVLRTESVSWSELVETTRHQIFIDNPTVLFNNITGTGRYIIALSSASQPVACFDLGQDYVMVAADFTLTIPSPFFDINTAV